MRAVLPLFLKKESRVPYSTQFPSEDFFHVECRMLMLLFI